MEQSKRENQLLYQRLLVYHCFRDSKSASEAACHLNQTYNDENFVSLQTVEALYGRFEAQSFNFDDLCRLDFAGRKAEETTAEETSPPSSTAEDEQMVVPVTPVVTSSDDLLLDDVELMFDSSEVTVNNNSISAPDDITAPTSAEEEENNSNEPLPGLAVAVVKRKRGRPPKARKVPEKDLIPLQPEPEVVVVAAEKRKRGRPPKSAKLAPDLEPASDLAPVPTPAPAPAPVPTPVPVQIEDPETTEELQPKPKIERKKKKAEASFAVPRPSLPREASRPKPKPPPKPKGRIRIRKKSTTTEETEKAPIDPKIFLPKAIAEGTARPEPLDDTAAGGVLDLLGKLSGKMSDNKRLNLRRRQLYLHCFQAKYSTAEAAKYLCSVYGEGFTSKSGVSGWYRRFRRNEFSLDDRKRPGAPAMIDGEELAGYMAANPGVTVTQLSERYQLHRTTIKKWLTIIGYRYVVDRWQKVVVVEPGAAAGPEAALTDRQLVEYRLKHPQATVREVAEHFLVNRGVVACRLRALGFDIPKWPRYAAKRYNSRERRWEYRPLGLHVQPGENVRKRTYKEIKESMERKKAREAAAAAAAAASATATSTATDPEENETNSNSAEIAATVSADDLMTVPEQLQMLELVQLDAQQQQQQQQAMMMTSTEANFASNINSNVSTLLPAVLRHKTNTSTAAATSTLNSLINSINSSSSSSSNLSNLQQTSALYPSNQSSFSSNHQALIQLNGNTGTLGTFEEQLQQQNIIVGPPSLASATTYLQTNGQLPYIAAVQQQGQQQGQLLQQTTSYESSSSSFAQQMGLDSAQVQSLLHPYYM